ncbi:hypothetical protein CO652_21545 [Rhizobium sp. H4]|nr:hypothetical protein CO652_21545 [Rhizobium sp. H4]
MFGCADFVDQNDDWTRAELISDFLRPETGHSMPPGNRWKCREFRRNNRNLKLFDLSRSMAV